MEKKTTQRVSAVNPDLERQRVDKAPRKHQGAGVRLSATDPVRADRRGRRDIEVQIPAVVRGKGVRGPSEDTRSRLGAP